jgi:hypothetical protein
LDDNNNILSESGCPGFQDLQDVIVRFSLVPWLCWGMLTGGSASTIFPSSLPGNAHRRLGLHYIFLVPAKEFNYV